LVGRTLVEQLLKELDVAIADEQSLDPFSFPEDTLLISGQSVVPVVATFVDGKMANIYKVTELGRSDKFISTSQSDGGIVVFRGGPWRSLKKAKLSFGHAPQGWTRY
jgi:hypothetical protein